MNVCEAWSSLKDIRAWAAVDDEIWLKFASNLGDSALDNISLLSALQPTDVKEAIEATQGNPIARAKLRLIYAVARMIFDLDPVDVGAPPAAASSGGESRTKAARTDTGLSLKVKVSSIQDLVRKNVLRSRYRSLEGEDPMKAEEVTDDQLSVLHHMLISACGSRLASVRRKVSSLRRTSWTTLVHGGAKRSRDLTASPRGKHAGACSELQPSCVTSRRQLFRTGTRLDSESGSTDSQTHGICACSPTPGVGRSCGSRSTVAKRSFTKPIQRFQHLFQIHRGQCHPGHIQ